MDLVLGPATGAADLGNRVVVAGVAVTVVKARAPYCILHVRRPGHRPQQ